MKFPIGGKGIGRPWIGLLVGITVAVFARGMTGCSSEQAQIASEPEQAETAVVASAETPELPDGLVDLGNATCPVMGLEVMEGQYADWNGFRVHFCCAGCDDRFLADPDAYLPVLAVDPAVAELLGYPVDVPDPVPVDAQTDCGEEHGEQERGSEAAWPDPLGRLLPGGGSGGNAAPAELALY